MARPMREQWDSIIEEFECLYPEIAEKVIDCYPSARYEITMKLENESRITYNWWDKQYYYIYREKFEMIDADLTEEQWRRQFSIRLNTKMGQFGMSRDKMSELTGISVVSLSKYCNARATPSGHNIRRIAKALRCSVSELTDF